MIAYFDNYKIIQNESGGIVLCVAADSPFRTSSPNYKPIFECNYSSNHNMGYEEMIGYGRAIADQLYSRRDELCGS